MSRLAGRGEPGVGDHPSAEAHQELRRLTERFIGPAMLYRRPAERPEEPPLRHPIAPSLAPPITCARLAAARRVIASGDPILAARQVGSVT